MMFSCCCPQIPEEAQIALVLSLLCGFSVDEIASAFLASVSAIEKRMSRGKKVLAKSTKLFELNASDFEPRLAVVQRALYLLFNEGYHGASAEDVVRIDLCREAMRLVNLLIEYPPAATPSTYALGALMHLHAARLPARVDLAGELTVLFEQDRSRWDSMLIARGLELLDASATGDVVSEYHLEAGIAATHATAPSASETNWESIVKLYDTLYRLRPSPVVALNRAIAIGELEGPARGLDVLQTIQGRERLEGYPFYAAAMGEMESRCRRPERALVHFRHARAMARNDAERRFLDRRIASCERLAVS
jgi:RNA polymerase sigma-70 factor (ECF subfamily)